MSSMTDETIAKEKEVDQRLVGKGTAGMMQGLINEVCSMYTRINQRGSASYICVVSLYMCE